jgi:hypothetical protein
MRSEETEIVARLIRNGQYVASDLNRTLPGVLAALIRERMITVVCIEDREETAGSAWQVVAVGLTTFVGDAVADQYLARPTAHFNLTLLERT